MSRNVLVRVFDGNGRPAQGARVVVWVYQFLAGGAKPEKYIDSNGEVEFDLDVDDGAEISINVNGTERVARGRIRGEYRVSI